MAEKKNKRKVNWIQHVILVLVLISILLVVIDVAGNLSESGISLFDQGGDEVETSEPTLEIPTPSGPTPTVEPVGPA
jgi:hypothetical protein